MTAEHTRAIALLADQLTEGFIALSGEYRLLLDKHRQLEEQLDWAKQHHLDVLKKCDAEVTDTFEADQKEYLNGLEEAGHSAPWGDSDWLEKLSRHEKSQRRGRAYLIKQAELACEKLKQTSAVKETNGVKIWGGSSADSDVKVLKTVHPVGQTSDSANGLEKDFTVPGTPSKLNCPFAKVRTPSNLRHSISSPRSTTSKPDSSANTRRSRLSSLRDPIEAEICGNNSATTPEVNVEDATTAVCPIRFLDQHKPEEVAEYFEKHKHEIPRSHEVCVKRFQSNAEQIRQLDNKYGNLVSMIQGLGQKHQPLLPDKLEDEEQDVDTKAGDVSDRVQKWARTVTSSMGDGKPEEEAILDVTPDPNVDEDRQPRFDRPMKEVRVGESPSRPWGIQVPVKYSRAGSVVSHQSPATASPQAEQSTPVRPSKCPFDHTKMQMNHLQPLPPHPVSDLPNNDTNMQSTPIKLEEAEDTRFLESPQPPQLAAAEPALGRQAPQIIPADRAPAQMIFSGPVFIGYSPEQIKEILGGTLLNRS